MNRILRKMLGQSLVLAWAVVLLSIGGCGKQEKPAAEIPTREAPQAGGRLTGIYHDRSSKPPVSIHFMGGNVCRVLSDPSHPVYRGTYTVNKDTLVVDLGVVKQPVTIVNATTLQTTWEGMAWTLTKE